MPDASPFLASASKRLLAGAVDAGPTLLLVIFGIAVADSLNLGTSGISGAAVIIYLAYHAGFNAYWGGETPGRRMLYIRLVDSRGGELTPSQAILRPIVRMIWIAAFFLPAFLTGSFVVFGAPILIDLFLMSALKWRQTTADFVCGTLVVNAPAIQPHRAPAGPMYSATDAEFGVPPRRRK